MKRILVAAATFAAFLAPHAAQAQALMQRGGAEHGDPYEPPYASYTVPINSLNGTWVVFESSEALIRAKISESRTAITIDGNKAKGEKLVVGMVCKIAYDPQQGEVGLKSMDCKS